MTLIPTAMASARRFSRTVVRLVVNWYLTGKTVEILDARGMPTFKGTVDSVSYREVAGGHILVANIFRPTVGKGLLHFGRTVIDVPSMRYDSQRKYWIAQL
jgi:hypothetical protein